MYAPPRHRASLPTGQNGVMLLEALLALLIFSIGVLAIVGMQATAVQDVSEAKYRTDASFLANQIVADMWSNAGQLATYQWDGTGSPPAVLGNWIDTVQARLPGSKTFAPTIAVGANNMVTVTVRWQQGRDTTIASAAPHAYRTVAYITCCL